MEHLDLAGMVTASHNWNLPTFEQQDAVYLSNSRQMLEPILEETSEEDEEHSHSSWSQYDHHFGFYSSAESETGSVIRVENNKDVDAISERDFACPAKRARRAQEFPSNNSQTQSMDDNVILRHYPKNGSADNIFVENSQTYESITRDNRGLPIPMQRNSTGNRRFDEFFSDSDSLSYNSLSRSSSLIQFESLERQLLLQDQHVSSNSLGASSPSLLSFDGINNKQSGSNEEGTRSDGNSGNSSRRGSQISLLRRFESSDGRLHQTYCQLDKLNFDDELDSSCAQPTFLVNTSLKNGLVDSNKTRDINDTVEGGRGHKRSMAKNSTENLSEDSGYCEPSPSIMLQRGMQQKFEKFSEEEEEYNAFIDMEHERYIHNENATKKTIWCTNEKINENSCNSAENENENIAAAEPKINNNATVDVDVAVDAKTNMNREIFVCSIKNRSPTRERNYERSFTHSPSPSSSIGSDSSNSSSSRSSCDHSMRSSKSCSIDSTASFNWLPIAKDQQLQPVVPQCTLELAVRETQSLRELKENFRNSLPDIRNVNCQENFQPQYYTNRTQNTDDGCGLEYFSIHTKSTKQKPKVEDINISVSPDFCNALAWSGRVAGANIKDDVIRNVTRKVQGFKENCTCSRSSSVPNELNKFEKFYKFHTELCSNRKRSCSWSALNNTTKESVVGFESEKNQTHNAAGYLNASYHNLTLLDYSGRQTNMNSNNLKRNSKIDRSDERVSADYESIICKGNFLLDELSQIYDRNASILNDRTVDSLLEEAEQKIALYEENLSTPKAPPRLKNVNSLDLTDEHEPENVQHVQFTIRKAPERHRKSKTNSLIETQTAIEVATETGSRTFDQDPTNLRTSYAQSLEKCNFDAKEVTSTDVRTAQRSLPKRRFHSHAVHAKKKNLVSSTPNLNSYEGCDEGDVEDDIYVSSAHTSMHQLPQGGGAKAQKPLGILLPIGSRTSFGKEVSFCPVVSKYCWHEQSSEECNAPELQRQDGLDSPADGDDEEDDENLEANERANKIEQVANKSDDDDDDDDDDVEEDDDVIYNTKENETIAVRDQLREREEIRETHLRENEFVDKRTNEVMPTTTAAAAAAITAVDNFTGICKVSLKPSIVCVELDEIDNANKNIILTIPANSVRESIETIETNEQQAAILEVENNQQNNTINKSELKTTITTPTAGIRNVNTRPLSMQLPILSEPPINRAHHILYASQQLLDKRTTRELIDDLERTHDTKQYHNIKATSVNNLQNIQLKQRQEQQINLNKMSTGQQQNKFNNNNNNNNNNLSNLSSNSSNKSQKIKPDEKHPRSIGFLSRFANGLRFSLRRNKKKHQQQQQQQQNTSDIEQTATTIKNGNNLYKIFDKNENKQKTPDFIYIPLKGPLPNSSSINNNSGGSSSKIGAKLASNGSTTTNNTTKIVTGKPPLPKQPPRIIHHNPHQYQQQQIQRQTKNFILDESAGATHAHLLNSNKEMQFLDVERSYYGNNNSNNNYGAADDEFSDNTTGTADYSAFRNQLMAGVQSVNCCENVATNNYNNNQLTANGDETFTSPSRATVAQKTQIFQNLANRQQQQQHQHNHQHHHHQSNGRLVNSIVVRPNKTQQHSNVTSTNATTNTTTIPIGLIETNLDTHETIILGKTRSLLDIAADRSLNITKQRRTTLVTTNVLENDSDNEHDDEHGDVDINDVGDVVIKKSTNSQGNKTQIASVRRPHKSMEFLLDKENQKNVLVSEQQ